MLSRAHRLSTAPIPSENRPNLPKLERLTGRGDREEWKLMLDEQMLREKITYIQDRREVLVKLLGQPNLGTLRIDVNQALEELDDLLAEFQQIFPQAS